MTNGICEIRVQGVKHPLYFGRLAQEEITRRTDANILGNSVKILTDMVFAGKVNHANKNELPFPTYGEVSDLVEALYEEEDAQEQISAMDECFRESKYGKQLLDGWEDLKKKMEELVAEQERAMAEAAPVSKSIGGTSGSTA